MTLPTKIDIQIIDTTGRPIPLENVLFGLKVFVPNDSWYNYSVFKSNTVGHITLTKQDIIDNTELKYNTNISSTAAPTVFELYVWEGQHTDDMIKMTKHFLELYNDKDFIEQDLKRHGITEENIPHALDVTKNFLPSFVSHEAEWSSSVDLLHGWQIRREKNSAMQRHFWTATIKDWKWLLLADAMKMEIMQSVQWLKQRQLISVYAYVIMPNHIHLNWFYQNGVDE